MATLGKVSQTMSQQAFMKFGRPLVRASLVAQIVLLAVPLASALPAHAHVRGPDDETETDRRYREKGKPPATTPAKPEAPKDRAPVDKATKDKGAPRPGESPADAAVSTGWSIAIHLTRGDEQTEAPAILARIRTQGGLPNAFLQKRGQATLIAFGNFADPDDASAQAELKRVQQLEVDGKRPYQAAYLIPPPSGSLQGRLPQYNLLRAKANFGDSALYTLQVAVYGREDLPRPTEADLADTRKAAEDAVIALRKEGEQAFYYHGPRLSMVTVGVFDLSDFDPQLPRYKSSKLIAAQKRHPYNLYNGAAIKEKPKGAPERLQPSNLVAIPSK